MAIIQLGLVDFGTGMGVNGVPVVYDTARGVIEQDPVRAALVGASPNVYGPGDVFFTSPNGTQVDYHTALSQALSKITSGGGTSNTANLPANTNYGPGAAAGAGIGSATQTTIDQFWKWLQTPIWPDDKNSLPNGMVFGGIGLAAFVVLTKKRRR